MGMGVDTCIMLRSAATASTLTWSVNGDNIYYYFNLHWQQAGVSCSQVYMHVRLVRVHTLQYKSFLQISCKLNGFLKKRNVVKFKSNKPCIIMSILPEDVSTVSGEVWGHQLSFM